MGDQKDHETIQKKDTEVAESKVETQDFATATESFDPPALQLKAEEKSSLEEGSEKDQEVGNTYQFSSAAPPENPDNSTSRVIGSDTIQGKGIAEPFKIPVVQKKESIASKTNATDKPSFSL